jgi:endo-1,4-beta-xylanase
MFTEGFNRRKFLQTAGGAGAGLVLGSSGLRAGEVSSGSSAGSAADAGSTPLKEHAAAKGLLYGSSAQKKEFLADAQLQATFVSQCDILVPELELKWDHLRPTPDSFDFSGADWLLNFAQQHQMAMRGHTIVWQDALPKWFNGYINPQNAKPLLLNHVSTVMGRYAGKIHSWDVVNEAIWPKDNRPDGLRDTPWLRNLGPGYMELAFRAAQQADPHALLTWNENWLEEESDLGDAKRKYFLQYLKDFLARGVPVQAIGIQSHVFGDHTNVAGPHFKDFLHQISDMGLKILVTEMDVRDQHMTADIGARDQGVADMYYQYLSTVLSHKSVVAVLTWGISDRYTWTLKASPRPDGAPGRPLLYDANMVPKPAWFAVAKAFDGAPVR